MLGLEAPSTLRLLQPLLLLLLLLLLTILGEEKSDDDDDLDGGIGILVKVIASFNALIHAISISISIMYYN